MASRERPSPKIPILSLSARLPRVFGVLLVCPAIALSLCGEVLAAQPTAASPTDTYTSIKGIGPAKRVARGLLRVKLRDAETVLTHGLDPEPPADAGGQPLDAAGPERQPVCASDYYQHVLYGRPSDAPDRLSSVKATILSEIKQMDALLNQEALASGGLAADYKVKCDGAGEVQVHSFQSAETGAQTTFSGVLSAARQAGFNASNADYTIFFDSSAPRACGTGTFSDDQRLTADNANNSGGDYAVTYSDCWTDRTAMHENGHNQGAVQYDAPYSTGSGAHCNDGYDVMCYSDGGDRDVGMSVFCSDKVRFDCRYDTYFDTAPEPGEYLESNWNLGSPLNRFIALQAAGPRKAVCEDGLDNDGDGRTDYPADLGCSAAVDGDETDLPACLDLRDNDGDARTDYPGDPGCSSALDNDESDPARAVDLAAEAPTQAAPVVQRLPTLTMAAARKYARQRIKRRSPRAKQIKAACSRRSRTSANCRVRWRAGRRVGYRGSMVIRYRLQAGRAALVASSRVRKSSL